ncbi:MAG: transaldolase family protein [Phycisphaerales bacterium]
MIKRSKPSLEKRLYNYLIKDFAPDYSSDKAKFGSNELWQRLNQMGTELWLDTGDIAEINNLWTQDFTAVTTNNTLLNKVVQTGIYDTLITDISEILNQYDLDDQQRKLEFAFALNAYHALRLVEKFNAFVSVEEHTDLAADVNLAVEYARRYYAICPERFIIKIPFTPAGLLATYKAGEEGIPINHTLGFSARQNYLIARIAKPKYVNVFLGRLNSFISENNLGDGLYVGEKAAIASNTVISELRHTHSTPCRQIAASIRDGRQILNLAGVNIMTMPPKAAGEFLKLKIEPEMVIDQTERNYEPVFINNSAVDKYRINNLWQVPDKLIACIDKLENEDLDKFTPDDILNFFIDYECGDIMVRWGHKEIETSISEGKIPYIDNWKRAIVENAIGIDSLMNLAGLCSFASDQKAMDERVNSILLHI